MAGADVLRGTVVFEQEVRGRGAEGVGALNGEQIDRRNRPAWIGVVGNRGGNGSAQLAHGGRGDQPVPHGITNDGDDSSSPGIEYLVPVASDRQTRGRPVAGRNLDPG